MLQRYLNLSSQQWGMVTSGRKLRVLRDFHHSLTKGYVELDIEGIFESGDIGDFRALYRLAHASRFVPDAEGICPLERFHRTSHEVGVEVGKQLRRQVKEAIEILANGFLDGALIAELQADPDRCRAYYREVLHLVYRMLFLFFVEQKGWLPMRDSLYVESYSLRGLQERANDPNAARDEHLDLWEGLRITFRLVRDGFTLGSATVPAYGGQLFDDLRHFRILGSRTLRNCELLTAVHKLSYFPRKKLLHKINYTRLQVDALGSVYESLLDYTPRVLLQAEEVDGTACQAGQFVLDPRGGARKTSGSYYTDRRLVAELIDSALRPVVADRLSKAKTTAEREKALLSIRVCDPACGSGAFLAAAMDALGQQLAEVRCGEEQPTDDDLRRARREVLEHCIYGVDLNDMAVELCKVSLWIVAAMPNMPLNFLDHHIKWGNSLIGATPKLIETGIPEEAFTPLTGDDRDTTTFLRKRNREERKTGQRGLFEVVQVIEDEKDIELFLRINAMVEATPLAVAEKEALYQTWHTREAERIPHRLANLWTAAFFWKKEKNLYLAPTHGVLRQVADGGQLDPYIAAMVTRLSGEYHFFHWHLEFPDVFGPKGDGGFDCVLGNPPWERVKLQEEEFFAPRDPRIANARNAAERKRLIRELAQTNPALHKAFERQLRCSEAASIFAHSSGRFPLTGKGDVNTYAVFAELNCSLINDGGRAGFIVQSDIATADTNKDFFSSLIEREVLVSFYDFVNKEGIFPGLHRTHPHFCLATVAGRKGAAKSTDFAFWCTRTEHLREMSRHFALSTADMRLLHPNTLTCPVFRTRQDAELTKTIYGRVPVLVSEGTESGNLWQVIFRRVFDMNSEDVSGSAVTLDWLLERKAVIRADSAEVNGECYHPVYESKLMWHFDHRFATYQGVDEDALSLGRPRGLSEADRNDTLIGVLPRYWLPDRIARSDTQRRSVSSRWLMVFRDVTNSTNERTMACTVIPPAATDFTLRVMFSGVERTQVLTCLVANLNSFVFDYVARQMIGGTHMADFVTKQLPVIPPSDYRHDLVATISRSVIELVFSSTHLKAFAEDCGYDGPPFKWDEERRAQLRAELDAIFFHLYGISREDAAYILDTFPIVRRRDEAKYGEYRTKRMILEEHDKLEGR